MSYLSELRAISEGAQADAYREKKAQEKAAADKQVIADRERAFARNVHKRQAIEASKGKEAAREYNKQRIKADDKVYEHTKDKYDPKNYTPRQERDDYTARNTIIRHEEKAAKKAKNESSCTLADLRAISEGFSPDIIAAYGAEMCLAEGANIQAFNIKHSENAKMAKEHMRNAKDAKSKGDTAQARKEYDAAIKCLKELQKECEKIEDDHLLMFFIETFIKAFVPMFVGVVFMNATGGISYIVGLVGSYICGMQKSIDYSAAIEKKLTAPNKAGVGGKADVSQWWKAGVTRGETMVKFDRMITACEKAKEEL